MEAERPGQPADIVEARQRKFVKEDLSIFNHSRASKGVRSWCHVHVYVLCITETWSKLEIFPLLDAAWVDSRTDVFKPALICLNINTMTKFLTGSSLVTERGFISKTQAKRILVSVLDATRQQRNLSSKKIMLGSSDGIAVILTTKSF